MKKHSKTILILAIVLIIIAMAYIGTLLITSYNEQKKEEAEQNSIIHIGNIIDASEITIEKENETLAFSYNADSDSWKLMNDSSAAIHDSIPKGIADQVVGLTAEKKISLKQMEIPASAYGLDNPIGLKVEDTSGNVLSLKLGITNSSICYAFVGNDTDTIYLIPASIAAYAGTSLSDILALETFPAIYENDIEEFTVTQKNKTVKVYKEFAEDGSYIWKCKTDSVDAPLSGLILKNSSKSAEEYVADFIANLSVMEFDSIAEYKGMDNSANSYGLQKPQCTVTIVYTDASGKQGNVSTLKLGNGIFDTENGDSDTPYMYYGLLDNSKTVNYIASAYVTPAFDLHTALSGATVAAATPAPENNTTTENAAAQSTTEAPEVIPPAE